MKFKILLLMLFLLLSACSSKQEKEIALDYKELEKMKIDYPYEDFDFTIFDKVYGKNIGYSYIETYNKKIFKSYFDFENYLYERYEVLIDANQDVFSDRSIDYICQKIDCIHKKYQPTIREFYFSNDHNEKINIQKDKISYLLNQKRIKAYEIERILNYSHKEKVDFIDRNKRFFKKHDVSEICVRVSFSCRSPLISYNQDKDILKKRIVDDIDYEKEKLNLVSSLIHDLEKTKKPENLTLESHEYIDNGDRKVLEDKKAILISAKELHNDVFSLKYVGIVNVNYNLNNPKKAMFFTFSFPEDVTKKDSYIKVYSNEFPSLTLREIRFIDKENLFLYFGDDVLKKILSHSDVITIELINSTSEEVLYSIAFNNEKDVMKSDILKLNSFRVGDDLWRKKFKTIFGLDVEGSFCDSSLQDRAIENRLTVGAHYQILHCGDMYIAQALPDKALFFNKKNIDALPIIFHTSGIIKGHNINRKGYIFRYNGIEYYDTPIGSSKQALSISPVNVEYIED